MVDRIRLFVISIARHGPLIADVPRALQSEARKRLMGPRLSKVWLKLSLKNTAKA
jgi:hypothetical protein